jgi:hypothetical protein
MEPLRSPFTRVPRGGSSQWQDGPAGALLRAEFFGAAPPGVPSLYLGAAGQSIRYLGARPPTEVYRGPRSLF